MAHLVIGYPTLEESLRTAETYIHHQIEIVELQIPFSHPTADGSVITQANKTAIGQGVTVEDCFNFMEKLSEKFPEQKIMVMTYLNKLFSYGIEKFCSRLRKLNIRQL